MLIKVFRGKGTAFITTVFPKIKDGIQDTGAREYHLWGKMAARKCTLINRCGDC